MKKLLFIQFIVALVGTIFAFYNVFLDFINYNNNCGSFLPVTSTFTHPFFTACFYGAFAFLICLFISIKLFTNYSSKLQKILAGFSAFGVAFAWANMALEIQKYSQAEGSAYVGCSGNIVSNPLLTPCFGGSVLFFLLALITMYIYKFIKNRNSTVNSLD